MKLLITIFCLIVFARDATMPRVAAPKLLGPRKWLISAGGDGSTGLTPSTAWPNIDTLNLKYGIISPGDTVAFHCGETFTGPIKWGVSGNSTNPIVITSYGTGARPLISGLTTLTGFAVVMYSPNIYKVNFPGAAPSLNNVIINDSQMVRGRYPNGETSYLKYDSAYGSTTAGAAAYIRTAATLATDWTGATLVYKPRNWVLDTATIQSQTGNIISFNQGTLGRYIGTKNYGFFIENDLRTLDSMGEWFYNSTTKDLSIWFGSNNPASYTIKASTIDTVFNSNGKNWLNIDGINFEGGNKITMLIGTGGGHINVTNCNFKNGGQSGVSSFSATDVALKYDTVAQNLGSGIFLKNSSAGVLPNLSVQYCVSDSTGMIPGMAISGDGQIRAGIGLVGNATDTLTGNIVCSRNVVSNTAYTGIEYQGSGIRIDSNLVNRTLLKLQDGGAIYTYNINGKYPDLYYNRSVGYNYITNTIGNSDGAAPDTSKFTGLPVNKGRAIYDDEGSHNIRNHHNIIFNCSNTALYANSCRNITFDSNLVYNAGIGWQINRFPFADTIRNVVFKSNQFYPYSGVYQEQGTDSPYVRTLAQSFTRGVFLDSSQYYGAYSTPFYSVETTTANTSGTYHLYTQPFSYLTGLGQEVHAAAPFLSTDNLVLYFNPTTSVINIPYTGTLKDIFGITSISPATVSIAPFTGKIFAQTFPYAPGLLYMYLKN